MGAKSSTIILLLVIFSLPPNTVGGTEIYKHVGADGHITFTNRPIKGAKKFLSTSPSSESHSKISETQKNFPHVSTNTQKERDLKRRKILLQELSTEEKFLTHIHESLSQINKNQKKSNIDVNIKSLQDKRLLHERNITALKKELSNL